jgi:hypothetical protein
MSLEALNALALAVRDAPSRTSVSTVCRQLTEYLTTARGDALRDVFRAPLRAVSGRVLYLEVLSALFALDDALYPEGWLSHAASSSSRAKDATAALAAFLHPQGPLLSAVAWADADGGVTYTFPEEQLPERTKRLLRGGPQAVASLRESLPYSQCLEAAPSGGATTSGRAPPVRLTPGLYFLFWLACAPGRPGGRSLRLGATEVDPVVGPPRGAAGGAHGHSQPLGGAKEKLTHAVGAGASLLQSVLHNSSSPGAPHGGAQAAQAATPGGSSSLQTPASPLPGAGAKLGHPYRDLLQGLLNQLAPVAPSGSSSTGATPLAGNTGGQPAQQPGGVQTLGGGLRVSGDMLVAICRDFWLSDPDDVPPSPPPHGGGATAPGASQLIPGAGLQRGVSGQFQQGAMQQQQPNGGSGARSWAFSPPQEDRVAAIRILVTHFHAVLPPCGTPPPPPGTAQLSPVPSTGFRTSQHGSTNALLSPRGHLAPSSGCLPSPLALACGLHPLGATLHRPLFTLLSKCFTSWPPDSHADMGSVLRLWAAVLTPWAFASPQQLAAAGGVSAAGESPWSAYVAATSPFSLALTQHFAAHCCRRVQVAPSDALSRAERGLAPLAALGDSLLHVLRDVEAGHNAAVADAQAGTPGAAGALPGGGAWTALGHRLAATLGEWEGKAGSSSALEAAHLLSASPPRTPLPGAFGGGGGLRLGGMMGSPSSPHAGTPAAAAAAAPQLAPLVVFDPHAGVGQWLAWMVERYDERCEAVPGGQHSTHHGLHVPHRRPDTRARLVNAIWVVTRVKVPPPQQVHTPGGQQGGGSDAAAAAALRLSRPGIASRMWADQDLGVRSNGPGDAMAWATMPIASFEIPSLVRLLVPLSLRINAALGLTSDVPPPWVTALPLPEAWHRKVATWRVNLRFLAETATLGWLAALWAAWRCLAWLGAALAGAM